MTNILAEACKAMQAQARCILLHLLHFPSLYPRLLRWPSVSKCKYVIKYSLFRVLKSRSTQVLWIVRSYMRVSG